MKKTILTTIMESLCANLFCSNLRNNLLARYNKNLFIFIPLLIVLCVASLSSYSQTFDRVSPVRFTNSSSGVSEFTTLSVTVKNTGDRFENYDFTAFGRFTNAASAHMNGHVNVSFCTPVYGLDIVIDDIDLQKKTSLEFLDGFGNVIPYTTFSRFIAHTGSNVNVHPENLNRLAADSKSNTNLSGETSQLRLVFPDTVAVKGIWFKNNWTDNTNRAGLGILMAKMHKPTLEVESVCRINKQEDDFTSYFQALPGETVTFDWYTRGIKVHSENIKANAAGLTTSAYTPLESTLDHYQVEVSRTTDGKCPIARSTGVRIIGPLAPVISGLKPATQTVCPGDVPQKLEVGYVADATYQWYKNTHNSNVGGEAISRATLPTYTPLSTAGTAYYYVALSRGGCVTYSSPLAVIADAACLKIALVKTGTLSSDGKTIKYNFEVENKGDLPLTDIAVTDPKFSPTNVSLNKTALSPGDKATGSVTYTITQGDKTAGKVSNSATVTAKNSKGETVSDKSGTTQTSDDPTVITVGGCTPDFNPIMTLTPNSKITGSKDVFVVIDIKEILGCSSQSENPIRVVVNKNKYLTLNWGTYSNITSISEAGISGLENADWSFSETPSSYIWTYKTVFKPSHTSKIGFKAIWNGGATNGQANFGVTVLSGSGGETNTVNNYDYKSITWARLP